MALIEPPARIPVPLKAALADTDAATKKVRQIADALCHEHSAPMLKRRASTK
jgi:hypothetical protein